MLRSKLLPLQFLDNTLVPWPDPVGANKMPVLMASNADGIHCLGASQGPRIIGNTIANAGDDAITIHSLYFIVAKVGRPPRLLKDRSKVFMFNKGLQFRSLCSKTCLNAYNHSQVFKVPCQSKDGAC